MFLIAGLILLLAGGSWFSGAITVGWILFGVGCAEVGLWLLCVFGFFATAVASTKPSRSRFR